MRRVLASIPLLAALWRPGAAESCDLYLAPSLFVGSGLGLYAGRAIHAGEEVDYVRSLSYDVNHSFLDWQLQWYTFQGYKAWEDLVLFGSVMMYNSNENPHISVNKGEFNESLLPQLESLQQLSAYSVYPFEYTKFIRDAQPGEELFFYYGELWYQQFAEKFNGSAPLSADGRKVTYSLEELERVGQCTSHVSLSNSLIPDAGSGVFAKKAFEKGELIQVSPVLVLAKHQVAAVSDGTSVLLNYCISRPDSDVALLPINLVGLCNHGGGAANAELEWFFWAGDRAALDRPPGALVKEHAASLYLGYRAARDIAQGEEITIDYGTAWEEAWADYLHRKKTFRILRDPIPLFRRETDAPAGLFPAHWLTECVGDTCGDHHDEL